jgi:hypothetical protein
MTKLGAEMERERPKWYEELSRPPFRTFQEKGIAAIMANTRRNARPDRSLWIKRVITISCLFLALAASIVWLYPLLGPSEPRSAASPMSLSGTWQTYQGKEYSFLLPTEWETAPGEDGRLAFIHQGRTIGNMAIHQYGLIYSRSMDYIYPANAKVVSQSVAGENSQLPIYYYFQFEIAENNGRTRLEDHYYVMQASITYDFYFPSKTVDKSVSEKIVQSFSPA